MNCEEIMSSVFELIGEPEDLRPYATAGDPTTFDITLAGSVRLLAWVNQALVRIANWQFPDGRILHARSLLSKLYFQNKAALTGTAVSATASTLTWAGLAPNNEADQFNQWLVETTGGTGEGQIREVIDCTGVGATDCTMTVHKAWDTTPDATTTFKMYKRMFRFVANPVAGTIDDYQIALNPLTVLSDVVKVTDVEDMTDLAVVTRDDILTGTRQSNSAASSFARFGDELWFDSAYDSVKTYELTYYRQPVALAAATDVPELPVAFHEAVVLWAVHRLQMREQDFTGAYATKRDLQEMMATLRLQGAMEGMHEKGGVVVWGE